jgi:hypothetical protein
MEDTMISKNIAKFRSTKNILFLVKASVQVFRQGRISEIIHGVYCSLFFKPSLVKEFDNNELHRIINEFRLLWSPDELYLSREQLINIFGPYFKVSSLPLNFAGARSHTIVHYKEFLIIGEYGKEYGVSRIALITCASCIVNDYYTHYSQVRHIHAIYKCQDSEGVMVTTGDSCKLLDLWELVDGELIFVQRIRKHFAGYTAIVGVNGHYYFGTDFSNRPNYIETLERKKYFFPVKAYRKWVLALYILSDRYIVSINTDVLGPDRTISIFDTVNEEFILCENFDFIFGEL